MSLKDFNLAIHDWIAALYANGDARYISLIKLFQDWDQICCINGTTTTNTVTINKLLQLLLLKVTKGFTGVDDFKLLINDQDLGQKVVSYLQGNVNLFCIGCPDKPFLQNPDVLPLINSDGTNTFRIAALGKEDVFGYRGTLRQPPVFSGIELAQFVLTANWTAPCGLTDAPVSKLCKEAGIINWGNAGASAAVLYNRPSVGLRAGTLRETLLYNLPPGKISEDALAPWERSRALQPQTVVPQDAFELQSVLTRTVLLIWDGDQIKGVYSGKGDLLPKEFNESLPSSGMLPTYPTITTKNGTKVFAKVQKNAPLWADLSTLFLASPAGIKGNGIHQAPIVDWWRLLAKQGLLPDELSYVVSSVIPANKDRGNLAATTINELGIPVEVFDESSTTGSALFSLFKFIADIERTFFRLNNGGVQKKEKSLKQMAPLSLFRRFAGLFPKDLQGELKMLTKYPMSGQFLMLAQDIFMKAVADTIDYSQRPYRQWKERISTYKEEVLQIAVTTWHRVIGAVPLSSPTYFQAVGYSHSKVRMLTNLYRKQIHGS